MELGQATTVKLISATAQPLRTLQVAWQASRTNEPLAQLQKQPVDLPLISKIMMDQLPLTELLDFVFLIEGASVSLREQLVRHRIGIKHGERLGVDMIPDLASSTWWAQSMRVLDMGTFYDDVQYVLPESVAQCKDPAAVTWYKRCLRGSQQAYKKLAAAGVPLEDARQVLPLATTHRLVWKLNLSSVLHICAKRTCWILQLGLWKPIVLGMIREIGALGLTPIYAAARPPCFGGCDRCTYEGCKFVADNHARIGGSDPLPPCALYLQKQKAPIYKDLDLNNGGRWNNWVAMRTERYALWGLDEKGASK